MVPDTHSIISRRLRHQLLLQHKQLLLHGLLHLHHLQYHRIHTLIGRNTRRCSTSTSSTTLSLSKHLLKKVRWSSSRRGRLVTWVGARTTRIVWTQHCEWMPSYLKICGNEKHRAQVGHVSSVRQTQYEWLWEVLGPTCVLRLRRVTYLRRLFAHLRGSGRIAAFCTCTEFFNCIFHSPASEYDL